MSSTPLNRPTRPAAHLRAIAALAGAISLTAFAPPSQAQRATEMYVPIGQSAGLSGKHTLQAAIQSVNAAERSITLARDGSSVTVKLGAQTPVWIDRSKLQQANSIGTLADARPGMLAEVKFLKNNLSNGEAEWLKLQGGP
jgi:hypothetical protein